MYRGESAQTVPCPHCGRPKAAAIAICPHCANGGRARIELAEATGEAIKREARTRWPRWLNGLLFVLSFPVIVPSLIVHWTFAKRWVLGALLLALATWRAMDELD